MGLIEELLVSSVVRDALELCDVGQDSPIYLVPGTMLAPCLTYRVPES